MQGLDASVWVTRHRSAGERMQIAVEFNFPLDPLAR
jgi:hypothetical protein